MSRSRYARSLRLLRHDKLERAVAGVHADSFADRLSFQAKENPKHHFLEASPIIRTTTPFP